SDFNIPTERGVVITNPPYGERMLDIKTAQGLYKAFGKTIKPSSNHRAYIITPDEEFETHFGRKADKKRKLYNGMLKCNLYMYFK
ncbi:MAG: class I SAM-dependent RNA methyltransferase, partial [Oscillospiraceae bacterium]